MIAKSSVLGFLLCLAAGVYSISALAQDNDAYNKYYDMAWDSLHAFDWKEASMAADQAIEKSNTRSQLGHALELKATALAGEAERWGSSKAAADVYQRLLDEKLLGAIVEDDPDYGAEIAEEIRLKAMSYLSLFFGDGRFREDILKQVDSKLRQKGVSLANREEFAGSAGGAMSLAYHHLPHSKDKAREYAGVLYRAIQDGLYVKKKLRDILESRYFQENPTVLQQAACYKHAGGEGDNPFNAVSMNPYGDKDSLADIYTLANMSSMIPRRRILDYSIEIRKQGKETISPATIKSFQTCLNEYAVERFAYYESVKSNATEADEVAYKNVRAKFEQKGCADFSLANLTIEETAYLCPIDVWANRIIKYSKSNLAASEWEPALLEPTKHADLMDQPLVREYCSFIDIANEHKQKIVAMSKGERTKEILNAQRLLTSCSIP